MLDQGFNVIFWREFWNCDQMQALLKRYVHDAIETVDVEEW